MSAETEHDKAERGMQQYLAGNSPLSAKYRAQSSETTPPELDSAVLTFAREQVQAAAPAPSATQRGRTVRRQHRRWAIPLATAATMLLGVDLVYQLRDQAVPGIAPDASVGQELRSAPSDAVADMASVQPQEAKAKRDAESERQEKAEREPARRAPMESQAAAPAASAAAPVVTEMLDATKAPQAELADAMGESAAKQEQAKVDAVRAEEGAVRLQAESRADGVMAQRERKAMAASGFASAMQRAPAAAVAPIEADDDAGPSAQDVAQTLLIWLRMDDFAAIRKQLNARAMDEQMLLAAANAARAMNRHLKPEISESVDGLWRIDYRDKALRCTAMLQLTSMGWTLLRIDVE